MSVIEFLCPNGHKIRCQAEQAGRPAKCPRCEVKFRVPDSAELAAGESDVLSKQDLADFDVTDEKAPSQNGGSKASGSKAGHQMEFLCPNGHRLFGSTDLAGRPGECPDCGSRFRIPTYEEISLGEKSPQDSALGTPGGTMPGIAAQTVTASFAPPAPPRVGAGAGASRRTEETVANRKRDAESAWEDEVMPANVWSIAAGTALVDQPVATLFARMWTTRPKGARMEIQMRDGEAVVIEQFMAALSQQSHGVFCIRSADNTYTLMAVAWDTIARVLVRGLSEMPKG